MELNWGNFWQWGRLRPWQILHSRLAQITTSQDSEDLELWQLLHNHMTSDTQSRSGWGEEGGDGDAVTMADLETVEWMWRYGGVKLSEWLESREEAAAGGLEGVDIIISNDEWAEGYGRGDEEVEDGEGSEGGAMEFESGWGEDAAEVRLAAARAAPPPLQVETRYYNEISAALTVAEEAEEEKDCPVCLEKLLQLSEGGAGPIWRLPCRHHFHLHCISPWLRQRSRCPCCRAAVDLEAAPPIPAEISAAPLSDTEGAAPVDLLSLVAEMEAALDSMGLL